MPKSTATDPVFSRIKERTLLVIHAHDIDSWTAGWVENARTVATLVAGIIQVTTIVGEQHPAYDGLVRQHNALVRLPSA